MATEETGPDAKIIKARGLPWSASADEVLAFFSECKVIGGTAGVHFGMNRLQELYKYYPGNVDN